MDSRRLMFWSALLGLLIAINIQVKRGEFASDEPLRVVVACDLTSPCLSGRTEILVWVRPFATGGTPPVVEVDPIEVGESVQLSATALNALGAPTGRSTSIRFWFVPDQLARTPQQGLPGAASVWLDATSSGDPSAHLPLVHSANQVRGGTDGPSVEGLAPVSDDAVTLTMGEAVSGSISGAAEVDAYHFEGTTGDIVSIALGETVGFNSVERAQVVLYSPTGDFIQSWNASTRAAVTLTNTGARSEWTSLMASVEALGVGDGLGLDPATAPADVRQLVLVTDMLERSQATGAEPRTALEAPDEAGEHVAHPLLVLLTVLTIVVALLAVYGWYMNRTWRFFGMGTTALSAAVSLIALPSISLTNSNWSFHFEHPTPWQIPVAFLALAAWLFWLDHLRRPSSKQRKSASAEATELATAGPDPRETARNWIILD